jgi:uncharacterized membrane protein YgcG
MIRFLCQLILAAACLLPLATLADERILEYRSDIHVHENGRLTVTEIIRVQAEGHNIRRGIYRDFPTRYRDRLGNYITVDFIPLSVRRNGNPETWHSKEMSNGVRIYAGSEHRMVEPGVHEYELVFSTNRQLGFFDDHDELYFNAIGNGWIFPIDKAVVTVTLPFQVPAGQLDLSVYLGQFESKEARASIDVISASKVRFETKRPLQPREGLTIAVGWPKGLIDKPALEQKIHWFLSDNAAAIVLLLGLLAPLGWYLWAWNKVGRDPGKGVIIPRFEPPEGLSPAATRYVKDMSFDPKAFTAAIISLAVKGQLVIEEEGKDFTLKRVPDTPTASLLEPAMPAKPILTPGEQAVLDSLLPHPSSSIEMNNENHAQFQTARKELHKELKKEYLGRLFYLNGIYLVPPILMSIAAAVIAAFFDGGPPVWISYLVLTMVLHGLSAILMRAPTPAGRLVMDEIGGFNMYLDTAEQDRLDRMRSPALTPEVFEAFLPYAYALGVENNWCQRFAREMPEEVQQKSGYHPGWYNGRFHGMSALNHLGDDFGSSFSSAISSASTPPGSSSGSGGGGSSGGGGGGGGGGGW